MKLFLIFVLAFLLIGCTPDPESDLVEDGPTPILVFVNETDQEAIFTVNGEEYKVAPKGCHVANQVEGADQNNKFTRKANGENHS